MTVIESILERMVPLTVLVDSILQLEYGTAAVLDHPWRIATLPVASSRGPGPADGLRR